MVGWCDWEWKSFFREGPGDEKSPSQYYEWGTPKTGQGLNWAGPDAPPPYYALKLARTFAPRVAGSLVKMSFNASDPRSPFELVYDDCEENLFCPADTLANNEDTVTNRRLGGGTIGGTSGGSNPGDQGGICTAPTQAPTQAPSACLCAPAAPPTAPHAGPRTRARAPRRRRTSP